MRIILFFTALFLFCIVATDIFWWIQISSDNSKSLAQVNKEYLEKFPLFISSGKQIVMLNILILTTSGALFFISKSSPKIKMISQVFLIGCIVIGLWQIFTLL